ncbi:nuclear transport factor 2 family protein [Janthinobacterium agaricidamnosum]|uniref:Lumazine-binding family protein n=1 Tax=Janthinobacterium agaricidamnosum NBRC 102515 = DSM 9628 TaxID=1349767 RepID=W0V759_9BURK|nr:nuclear transport factor 2 family protein [Janthinobacterium agaricidamnosum]CDG83097.1 putative uncharacterized protein [Janthinobacterium agaricidamnosum NBRC 102515 = DSM 9628]
MQSDHHASIEAIVDAYLSSVYSGDTTTLAQLFNVNAQVFGEIDGNAYHKPIAAYLNGVASRQSPQALGEPYRMRLLAVDQLGSIATATLHSPMLGFNYQLYLTLRRLEGKWSIVNKTFTNIGTE